MFISDNNGFDWQFINCCSASEGALGWAEADPRR
jgi:hypothetical protein